MLYNFLILLGCFNLIFLNIRLIIGILPVFKGDINLFWKWFNVFEVIATTVMLYVLFKNYSVAIEASINNF